MWWALSEIGKSRLRRQQVLNAAYDEGWEIGFKIGWEQGYTEAVARFQNDPEYRRRVLAGAKPSVRCRRRRSRRCPTTDDSQPNPRQPRHLC